LAPQFAEPYNNLGLVYKIKGEFGTAISYFLQSASQNKKTYASPHNHLAAVYLAQGKLDEAMTQAKKAVKIDPLMADAHFIVGLVWFENKNKYPKSKYLS
jgi:tetratricopeptide (TPR) repeat protein